MTVFNAEEAAAARDEAIARAAGGAGDGTKEIARRLIIMVCNAQEHFTMDDVWRASIAVGEDELFREPRVWGAVIRAVEAEGYCEPTDEWRLSKRVANHRRPMRIWHSLVWV